MAANIENGSLILIDEPEISLHPAWQEQYMPLLNEAVAGYISCQFIVATHSPQIVANTPVGHSYIASLTSGELISVDRVSAKSADYQLAEVFRSPGWQNEYLNKLAVNLLARIAKRRVVAEEVLLALEKLRKLARKGNSPLE